MLNIEEIRFEDVHDDKIIELIRTLTPAPNCRLLIDFDDFCEISLHSMIVLSSIYTETLENGIEIHFYNAPNYFCQMFPDIPVIDKITTECFNEYQYVLVHRYSEFKLVSLNLDNSIKKVCISAYS
ncbi:MAG: hypothetical protein A2161_18865 [Candidatus Schekmanbacteria bacterium RBG_13_48_7]|uniref:STAS domain-containing protein n=1 Tax=Candidatus Schekmanbacteria bacterium RBG_13_48_7 TaxID=1817878 RepID=A0A1F7RU35_9BACT|nr:MAG: hypothetical protein A2161_18865 [Candidatus Schekmanbacteria bacterium RBG_13_48_7]